VEGDISQCFDSLDHEILLSTLKEKIHDGRFLHLIQGLLNAGYLEDWKWNETHSGAPQGGIVTLPTMWQAQSLQTCICMN
jgi:retron-type reverse transcriptase